MNGLRRFRFRKALLGTTVLILVLVQQAGLHVHNHEVLGDDAFTLHIFGVSEHVSPHDQNGEIEFTFSALILKALTMPGILITGMVLMLLMPFSSFLLRRDPGSRVKPRSMAFRLRPPARASPL